MSDFDPQDPSEEHDEEHDDGEDGTEEHDVEAEPDFLRVWMSASSVSYDLHQLEYEHLTAARDSGRRWFDAIDRGGNEISLRLDLVEAYSILPAWVDQACEELMDGMEGPDDEDTTGSAPNWGDDGDGGGGDDWKR
jgi:hypothetical protein